MEEYREECSRARQRIQTGCSREAPRQGLIGMRNSEAVSEGPAAPSPVPSGSNPCRTSHFSKQQAAGEGRGTQQEGVGAAIPPFLNDDCLGRLPVGGWWRGRAGVAAVAGGRAA